MRERGILFSKPMILALLAGRKTQTRRLIKFGPAYASKPPTRDEAVARYGPGGAFALESGFFDAKPAYRPHDLLWVRETHAVLRMKEHGVVAYRASCDGDAFDYFDPFRSMVQRIEVKKWTPSIFMKREHSRIAREVTGVRAQPLLDISAEDALAEGLEEVAGLGVPEYRWPGGERTFLDPRECYLAGWDMLHGKGSAEKNPWVFAYSFTKGAP